MTAPDPDTGIVLTPTEARGQMGAILRRFRQEPLTARPVIFGFRRQPEAVILPYDLYAALTVKRHRSQ